MHAELERTGKGSNYRFELGEDGLQNGKLLRGTEGEGERWGERCMLRYHGKQDN